MLDKFQQTSLAKSLVSALSETKDTSILIEELWDCPKALILSLLLEELRRPIVVVSGGDRQSKLFEDLLYFHPKNVKSFPAWESLPGEEIAPSPDVMGKRLDVLKRLCSKSDPLILLTSLQGLLQKVVSPHTLQPTFSEWRVGMEILFEEVVQILADLGYTRSKLVTDKGQFAVRGSIIDIFPIAALDPYRIEFFDETIEQIRVFDPMKQTSLHKVESIKLTPSDEYTLLMKEKNPSLLTDYLEHPIVVFDDLVKLEDRWISLKSLSGSRSPYFYPFPSFLDNTKTCLFFTEQKVEELSKSVQSSAPGRTAYSGECPFAPISFDMFDLHIKTKRTFHPFEKVSEFLDISKLNSEIEQLGKNGFSCHFLADGDIEEKKLKEALGDSAKTAKITKGYLSSGLVWQKEKLLLFPLTELTHRHKVRRSRWRNSYHTPASEFHELAPGDLVVHFHNGIGKFLGIEKQSNHLGQETEFLVIEYAANSKLFVPMNQSHLVSRYIGAGEETPDLHKLGTNKWTQTKEKVQASIVGYAKDLLAAQAEREHKGGFCFPEDGELMAEFHETFPYVETEDQLKAIHDITVDMTSTKAMDRLVLGDVGYGKTEVAMRAAFKAVVDGGKQVAILVPTTVLAMQHYESFKERMEGFPVKVGIASRFQKPKELLKTMQDVAEGKIDILIGTHRLLSKDVLFKNLGLIVIDEEQRFGVRAKEKLKTLKAGVDCLTLSATPIPRTLYMSLINLRDLSVINSPPGDRLPIKTIICEKEKSIIHSALLRELSRDGQVYYIHNRVETIYKVGDELSKILPSARIGIVHGQMTGDGIDRIFHSFKNGEIDVLLATTIVENGIDVPNAGTIMVDRADTFGISALYQLRGRVGRWNRSAYAYFMTPYDKRLSEVSSRRLRALVESSGLGGAMKLAMIDLEIRGAGDLLGTKQSGHLANIGFHLYCKLLKRTINALVKNESTTFLETRMEFTYDAKLPAWYIEDSSLRLEIYHRLGECTTFDEVDEILKELKDRFGNPPDCVLWLYHMTRIKVFASRHHFTSLKFLTHTLAAERKGKTKVEKQSILLPKKVEASFFEAFVIEKLTHNFQLEMTGAL